MRPDRENAFLAFVKGLQRERLQDRAETLEAALLRIVDGLRECMTPDGLLPVRLVTQRLNEGRLEKDHVTPQRVGVRLRSLGFGKGGRDRDGMLIWWDEGLLARTMEAYGLRDSAQSSYSTQPPPATPEGDRGGAECVECEELQTGAGGSGARRPSVVAGSELQPEEPGQEPSQPCYTCRGTRFWLDGCGVWKCGSCHAPPSEGLVQRWLEVKSDEAHETHAPTGTIGEGER